jgi:hypothetical protein
MSTNSFLVSGVEITFGVSLSKAAIKALTQDIVWYENQTVELNGKQYTALMPRLYLAGATLEDDTPKVISTPSSVSFSYSSLL